MTPKRPIEILLVEDSPGDVVLVREALRQNSVPANLHHVNDGAAAMAFLRRQDIYVRAPRPDIILLDLNMPRMNGREFLQQVKSDEQLRSLPVIALTTSDAQGDIHECYELGVNAYIVKPVDVESFFKTIQSLENFWFAVAELPSMHED